MPNPDPATRYRDAQGVWHAVEVHRAPDGGWEVLDVTTTSRQVIETLTGVGETRDAAVAVARDFAAHRHHPKPGST
jgi:hypothetical protein